MVEDLSEKLKTSLKATLVQPDPDSDDSVKQRNHDSDDIDNFYDKGQTEQFQTPTTYSELNVHLNKLQVRKEGIVSQIESVKQT